MASVTLAWKKRYSRKLLWTDLTVVLATAFGASALAGRQFPPDAISVAHLFAVTLSVTWLFFLQVYDSRSPTVFGTGPEEYKRVITATTLAFGLVAILVVLTSPRQLHEEPMVLALPVGLVLLVFGRWIWRKRLQVQRKRKRNTYRTLIVGSVTHASHTLAQLRRNTIAGYEVIGAITDPGSGAELAQGVPVFGSYGRLLTAVSEHNIDTIIITGSNALPPDRVRAISWELEGLNVDLIVAAALTDIAGPRIHIRPVSGLPLIHVELPEFTGLRHLAKRCFDLIGAALLLLIALPVLVVLAIAIRRDSPGPILFRQVRLGLGGEPFTMFKLRSMVEYAEDALPGLLDRSEGRGPLFKIEDDPRLTRVGRFMRKHSLDELPQLVNVLRGEMSLVGPRPPLPSEAETYNERVSRRLLVRPGISGLWQVSGRSDLSWDETVRLDLFYVENWSITGDLLVLWRTIRTIVRPEGAY